MSLRRICWKRWEWPSTMKLSRLETSLLPITSLLSTNSSTSFLMWVIHFPWSTLEENPFQHFPVLSFSTDLRAKKRRSTSTVSYSSSAFWLTFVLEFCVVSWSFCSSDPEEFWACSYDLRSYAWVFGREKCTEIRVGRWLEETLRWYWSEKLRGFNPIHPTHFQQVFNHPFPANSSWQHCQGSNPSTRFVTPSLSLSLTPFLLQRIHLRSVDDLPCSHSSHVHRYHQGMPYPFYRNLHSSIQDEEVDSLKPLKAIQGWVKSFFGCEHCKNHFMNMTTKQFPMNERRVRIHSIVGMRFSLVSVHVKCIYPISWRYC